MSRRGRGFAGRGRRLGDAPPEPPAGPSNNAMIPWQASEEPSGMGMIPYQDPYGGTGDGMDDLYYDPHTDMYYDTTMDETGAATLFASQQLANQQVVHRGQELMDRDIQHREMQTAHMDSINTDYEHASEAMNEHALQKTREIGKQKLAYAKHQNSVKEKKKSTHIKAKKALADVEDQRQAESDASMARINDMDNEARVAEATREKQREEARKKKLDKAREDADHWTARSEKSAQLLAAMEEQEYMRTMEEAVQQDREIAEAQMSRREGKKKKQSKTMDQMDSLIAGYMAGSSSASANPPASGYATPQYGMHPQAIATRPLAWHPQAQTPPPQRMLPAPQPQPAYPWQQMQNMSLRPGSGRQTPGPAPVRTPQMAMAPAPARGIVEESSEDEDDE